MTTNGGSRKGYGETSPCVYLAVETLYCCNYAKFRKSCGGAIQLMPCFESMRQNTRSSRFSFEFTLHTLSLSYRHFSPAKTDSRVCVFVCLCVRVRLSPARVFCARVLYKR